MQQKPNSTHCVPYQTPLPGNKSISIAHLGDMVDVPVEFNCTGMNSGSIDFVGYALVFDKATGEPFAVTYPLMQGLRISISINNYPRHR